MAFKMEHDFMVVTWPDNGTDPNEPLANFPYLPLEDTTNRWYAPGQFINYQGVQVGDGMSSTSRVF
jgi:hypothetical protein